MRRHTTALWVIGVLIVVAGGGIATYTLWQRNQPVQSPDIGLRPITFQTASGTTPTAIANIPPLPGTNLFAHPAAPAYVAGQGFDPDVQRMLDIVSLQTSLARYYQANHRYPATLADLFPSFAPTDVSHHMLTAPPVDPTTHKPYDYQVSANGSDYQLSAMLANGRRYSGIQHTTGPPNP